MDPDVCLEEMLDAIDGRDTRTASDRLESLRAWVRNRGFLPAITPKQFDRLLDAVETCIYCEESNC